MGHVAGAGVVAGGWGHPFGLGQMDACGRFAFCRGMRQDDLPYASRCLQTGLPCKAGRYFVWQETGIFGPVW